MQCGKKNNFKMTLDLFQEIRGITEEQLHPKYKFLKNTLLLDGERKIITSWTDGFVDRDNKIIKEFQTTFHSSFWEFYLFRLFVEMGLIVDFSKDRPDFIINQPNKIYFEAVVSNIKEKGRQENTRNLDDILSMLNPPHLQKDFVNSTNEAITRHSNAINSKYKKFIAQYSNLEWVDNNAPFVIALASYDQVNYGREFYYPLLALLYGRYFNHKNGKYEFKKNIIKPDTNSEIPLGLFNNNSMENISAILFSCTITLGKLTSLSKSINNSKLNMQQILNVRHDDEFPNYKIQDVNPENPEELSDGLFIFHNPFAKNPLPFSVFEKSNAIQITVNDTGFRLEGNNSPIVSRLNISKILMPDTIKTQIMTETINRFNSI